jgi:hypothetical protein
MEPWKLVLDEAVFQSFVALRATDRRKALEAFERLRCNPTCKADFTTSDSTGRALSVIGLKPFLVTYWLDVFVSEIRIVNIQRIRY